MTKFQHRLILSLLLIFSLIFGTVALWIATPARRIIADVKSVTEEYAVVIVESHARLSPDGGSYLCTIVQTPSGIPVAGEPGRLASNDYILGRDPLVLWSGSSVFIDLPSIGTAVGIVDGQRQVWFGRSFKIESKDYSLLNDEYLGHGITSLDLSYTGIDDISMRRIGPITRLRSLNLSSTPITSAGIDNFSTRFSSLEYLDISYTSISDSSIENLRTLKTLKSIRILGSQITPSGINSLHDVRPDIVILK